MISAQTTSSRANALYSAAALDLPRRGPVHVTGGIGAIAQTLAQALTKNGGELHYRQQATRIRMDYVRPASVETKRGSFPADIIIANLTPAGLKRLLGAESGVTSGMLPDTPPDGWGAFTLYLGLDEMILPSSLPLHHQILYSYNIGEGNSVFLSISPSGDPTRAPTGKRALTLSTHTQLGPWWDLFRYDPEAYESRKNQYAERMIAVAERGLPGLREAIDLSLPGTPINFERFTRRPKGWVGGYPQTSLFRNVGPRVAKDIWLVGDSIFPGQSIPAVALGGMRVAQSVLQSIGKEIRVSRTSTTEGNPSREAPMRSLG